MPFRPSDRGQALHSAIIFLSLVQGVSGEVVTFDVVQVDVFTCRDVGDSRPNRATVFQNLLTRPDVPKGEFVAQSHRGVQ